jgi:hypothetical protein
MINVLLVRTAEAIPHVEAQENINIIKQQITINLKSNVAIKLLIILY